MKNEELFQSRSVPRAVFALAVPSIVGQIILVIYSMADTFFVARTGSSVAVTAVTVCTPAFMFLSAISNLFGVGGASAISRALGQGDAARAKRASAFAFFGCVALTLVYALFLLLWPDGFLDALGGADPAVHEYALRYLFYTVVLGGLPTALSALFAHLLRANGASLCAGIGTALGGLCNLALDPLFMFVLLPRGREVEGAAVATALSNAIALIYFAIALLRRRRSLSLSFVPSRPMLRADILRDVLTAGLPACIMTLFENISFAVLDYLLSLSGVAVQAGVGVAKKVNMLAHCMVRGMAQGVLPLIGYSYAAGNRRRMRSVVLFSTSCSVLLASVCTAVCLLFSRSLISVFLQPSSASLVYGARFLRILCLGAPFSACAYAFISFFQGVGCGGRSCMLAILRKGLLDIPLMLVLERSIPVYGCVWATPVTDVVCCAVAVILFRSFLAHHAAFGGQGAQEAALPTGGDTLRGD